MLTVRKLNLEFKDDLPLRLMENDAFFSALLVTMSFYFPVGEKYIMSSLSEAMKNLDEEKDADLIKEIKIFNRQEAFHKKLHSSMNELFEKHTKNKIDVWVNNKIDKNKDDFYKGKVGLTMASEHTTSLLAFWFFKNIDVFKELRPDVHDVFAWHCSEEIEHRGTAFKVYSRLGGTAKSRKKYLINITIASISYMFFQTMINLYYEGSLFKFKTWKSLSWFVFSKEGILRSNFKDWKSFWSEDFDPDKIDATAAINWLDTNRDKYQTFSDQKIIKD